MGFPYILNAACYILFLMRIALVHDQLQEFGGAERVFLALKKIYPSSDVFTAFYNEETLRKHAPDYKAWKIKTSLVSRIPFFVKLYSPLRFLAPVIWESFDFSQYDLVISSSGWYMSKNIKTKKPTIHISYIHHPPRYLYGYETAMEWQKHLLIKIYANIINHRLRIWDYYASQRADYFIANSEDTKKRVVKFYKRNSTVIYPPVDIPKKNSEFRIQNSEYYVTLSRLARAKHIEILIDAANKNKFKLKIVGVGRDLNFLKSIAGPTVEFLGHIEDKEFGELFTNAKAFLFASVDEEFGIAPVEAMGFGVPVIAYSSGGLKETVKPGINGYLFEELSSSSLLREIKKLETLSKEKYLEMRKNSRKEAEKYSFERFKKEILQFVKSKTK